MHLETRNPASSRIPSFAFRDRVPFANCILIAFPGEIVDARKSRIPLARRGGSWNEWRRRTTDTHTRAETSREETRGHGKTRRTLVPPGEKAAASIMDIFIIVAASRGRDLARLGQSRRRLDPIGPAGPPRDINIDENDAFIRQRQVRPRLKSRKIYRDAASRRQPFPSGSYIKLQSPDRFSSVAVSFGLGLAAAASLTLDVPLSLTYFREIPIYSSRRNVSRVCDFSCKPV